MPRHPFPRSQRACARIISAALIAAAAAFCITPHARAATPCSAGRSPTEAAALSSALGRAAARLHDEHALALIDLTTGVLCGQNAGTPMITASIVKVSILSALLVDHQQRGTPLSATERAAAARMIEHSDNNAADALFHEIGGASGLQRFFDAAGMRSSAARKAWGLTVTTPADQARLLAILTAGHGMLSDSARAYTLGLMRSVERAQRWGVPYRAARGVSVAVKNGWLPTDDGWHINSLGAFTGGPHTYVMAVMTEHNGSEGSGIGAVQTLAAAVNTTIMGAAHPGSDTDTPNPAPGTAPDTSPDWAPDAVPDTETGFAPNALPGSAALATPTSGASAAYAPVPQLPATAAPAAADAFKHALITRGNAPSTAAAAAGAQVVPATPAAFDQPLTPGSGAWPTGFLALLGMCSSGALAATVLLRRRRTRTPGTTRTPRPTHGGAC